MSSDTPNLQKPSGSKRVSGDEPVFIRSLVASPPLHEGPATAVVEEPAEASTAPDARSGAWDAHLAQLLHSMYLVSFTEKAQLGAMYSRNGAAAAQPAVKAGSSAADATSQVTNSIDSSFSASAAPANVEIPMCSHSITVDERWLNAVTRHCHFTVTLDDVARVAMVFPELLRVRWTMEEQNWSTTAAPYFDELLEHPAGARSNVSATTQCDNSQLGTAATIPLGGKLIARVYLCQNRVVSVEEAAEQLTRTLRLKGSVAAQRAWKALVNHHTGYAAYVDGPGRSPRVSKTSTNDATLTTDSLQSSASLSQREARKRNEKDAQRNDSTLDDEALCGTISAELRASLSAPKLRALLRQMRKDATHVEEAEQHLIAQRQLQERMLNAYEHVRALYGPKDTRGRSALTLVAAMQQESRFEDTLDSTALLSSLLAIPASGLSATMLCEGRVVVEPVTRQAQPTAMKGVPQGGKRKRAEEDEATRNVDNSPVAVRVMEPSLEPATDLRGLTDAQLELVLVRLDRTKGSVRGVMQAVAREKG
ncbi:hypothetical protein ABB37_04005 [Leptomonas pyrrhocoris]|uniref:Uncharacterized protein n=1 Tax=Leptomonas pyrrhocoris TaxID=157538 RepID=A0A0N0DWK3_LEPPY|nr:hypothetical protein ABB37_04005 [Leptomonas pyrrhocoris]XP_015660142.1 hypothetical protein ABB37_04005 [Leptomonas pyrrhocoris]XP_015660143.1 hypothetical protein ABB37_04005 [Leptomonas pyrrhocoris]KPA81702.1 hypothetical protein ABB37_04005 [Leptomonas pyrrhocoris]KPA81703.1 hypothetical protein ABB37_04005 [Leptomonas pyrrhocoris]KPA81704.1 hypothetical protein ABB37_04005 [Leptomonas pyrrhocoris]|eukprot:XP_015660141.1 hypothetical protein ABB37_04005 [Leptomonas pyrrhocoris]